MTMLQRFDSAEKMAEQLLTILSTEAKQCIRSKGCFRLILAGGNTPAALYRLLASSQQQWDKWQLFYGDERYLPVNDSQRNNMMVEQCWLNSAGFPESNHHIVPFSGQIDEDAQRYSNTIAQQLPADIALLGIGEDGHTASLFPGSATQALTAYPVIDAPKPPPQRITLSEQTLNQSRLVLFIASGQQKEQIIEQGMEQNDLPFSRIHGTEKTLIFLAS